MLTIWNKTVQSLLLAKDVQSSFLAAALVGTEEIWQIYLWHYMIGEKEDPGQFHLPQGLKANTRHELFDYYDISAFSRASAERWEIKDYSGWKSIGWKIYLNKLYEQQKKGTHSVQSNNTKAGGIKRG